MKIHVIDLHYQGKPKTIAAYLVEGPEGLVLVETGPGSTLGNLRQALASLGYGMDDIQVVLVTHIHLDHAGAAGWWAQQGARVFVHHLGAPHVIDPSRLLASASRIYGDEMDTLWGETLPAPASQVTAVYDGDPIEAGGLLFRALETPGHASHHHAYFLDDIAFAGDVAGIRLPGIPLQDLPAPPPEFHLLQWQESIDRLLDQPLTAIYPTHFGRVDNWKSHLKRFASLLGETNDFVYQRLQAGTERDEIVRQFEKRLQQRAMDAGVSAGDVERMRVVNPPHMTVDGIIRYWRKRRSSAS